MSEEVHDLPQAVSKIKIEGDAGYPKFGDPFFPPLPKGTYVSVRLAGKEDTKTYLGIYLGDMAIGLRAGIDNDGVLVIRPGLPNPAMFVPDLGRIVLGIESWWGELRSKDDLEQITDTDIENVWYVQALKALLEKEVADGKV